MNKDPVKKEDRIVVLFGILLGIGLIVLGAIDIVTSGITVNDYRL